MTSGIVLAAHPSRAQALTRAWADLTGVGPTLTAAERVRVIAAARRAWSGQPPPSGVGGPMIEAAYWIGRDAGGVTGEVVEDLERLGLDRFRYLEVVGVVARVANVDFFRRGLGGPPLTLPETGDGATGDGAPTGDIDPTAAITDGWVPATGPLFAPASLDALPAEGRSLRALHEPMYMPMAEMGDPTYLDILTRAQIEYIASRTSYLNECFY